jgi:hypothetical protein
MAHNGAITHAETDETVLTRKIMNSPTKVNSNLGRYLARRNERKMQRLTKIKPVKSNKGFA